MSLSPGTRLGSYQIVSRLAAGGMGEVYRARHLKLEREVAVKVLPDEVSGDPERLRRFEREARTASSLNHPNIVTIHDIDEQDGTRYIAMELVEGKTLRQRLGEGPVSAGELVALATQIAEGLAKAHAAGIVHRDLKPENLMVTDDGLVKILDFGLAKLAPSSPDAGSGVATLEQATRAGLLLGTVPYMSPEQAAGRPLDHRSDQFSFGSILYEMATGAHPFQRASAAQTLAAIIEDEPRPLTVDSSFPVAVARVVERCLCKQASERYASTGDLATELRSLARATTAAGAATGARSLAASGAKYALVAVLAAVVGLLLWTLRPSPARPEWVRLTDFPDSVTSPALSPDGRMLAFLRGPGTFTTSGQVYVKMLPAGEAVQLTHDSHLKMGPVFSPDGSRIAYTVPWDTWEVPVLGGEPRLWLPNASGLTWIAADRRILFSEIKTGLHMAIVTSNENRAAAQDVYVPADERMMAHRSYASPDGRWALVVEMETAPITWLPCRLVSFDGLSPESPVGPPRSRCTSAAWSPDGRWMYFTADTGTGYHVWRQRFPDGPPEQMTFGPTEEEGIAVAGDGRSLITSVGQRQGTVWIVDGDRERQLSAEGDSRLSDWGNCFSPDGSGLYYLKQSTAGIPGRVGQEPTQASELWHADVATSRLERVLAGFAIETYDISEDGRSVAFKARSEGQSTVWIASLDRRTPPRPLASAQTFRGGVLLAGQHVFFAQATEDLTSISRLNVADGTRETIVTDVSGLQGVSPDGQWIVAVAPAPGQPESLSTVAYPLAGGAPAPVCSSICYVRWDRAGRHFYLSFHSAGDADVEKTFVFPLATGRTLPELPPAGVGSREQAAALHGVSAVEAGSISPGPTPSLYAFTRPVVHRNLFRIPVP